MDEVRDNFTGSSVRWGVVNNSYFLILKINVTVASRTAPYSTHANKYYLLLPSIKVYYL